MTDHEQTSDGPQKAEVYRPTPGAPARFGEEGEGFSLVQVLNVLLRHRWKVVGVPLIVLAVIGVFRTLSPVTYTSRASFMSQTGGGGGALGQFSGVASRFGINVPSGQAGQSPQFYASLLRSPWLTEQAVTTRYRRSSETSAADGSSSEDGLRAESGAIWTTSSRADSDSATLVELYGIQSRSEAAEVAAAAGRLRGNLSVVVNSETGVVTVGVTTPWPTVSKQVADQLIELVNRFNNRTRQSQASAQARFIQGRLGEAEQELRAAEDSLERFLERNVGWQQSPELRFQQQRLQRRVTLKQEVFTSLASRYEEARIAEVKSTPVVTTVNPPKVPLGPDSTPLALQVVLGLIVGGTLGTVWAFGSEFRSNVREEHTEEYREFISLRQDATEDVKQVGRAVRRLIESGRGSESD